MEVSYFYLGGRNSFSLTLLSIQRGNTTLAGQEEKDIPSHCFPPDNTKSRTICFKGEYLSIYTEQTEHRKTLQENVTGYLEFEVPPGYTCYIIGASVYFKL
jgi:hypothetical protein